MNLRTLSVRFIFRYNEERKRGYGVSGHMWTGCKFKFDATESNVLPKFAVIKLHPNK